MEKKYTLKLEADLVELAREHALAQGITLKEFVEQALFAKLEQALEQAL